MSLTLHGQPMYRHTSSSRPQTPQGNTVRAMISCCSSSRSSSTCLGLLAQCLFHFSAPLRAVVPAARHGTVTASRKDPARTDPCELRSQPGLWDSPGGPRGNCANTSVADSTPYAYDFEAETHVHPRDARQRRQSREKAAFLRDSQPHSVTPLTAQSAFPEKSPQQPAPKLRASNRHLPCFSATAPPLDSSVITSECRTGPGIRPLWKRAHSQRR